MKRAIFLVLFFACLVTAGPGRADDQVISLPAGTDLHVKLTTTLSTKTNESGDPWVGKVVEPIFAEGREVVPANSTVDGHITYVQPAGRVTGKGEMRIVADTITVPEEGTFAIVAALTEAQSSQGAKLKGQEGTIEGPGKDKGDTAVGAGVGAGIGAAAGGLTAGPKGALYGAGIGAVAGVVRGMVKKHKGVVLPPGTEMTFTLSRTALSKQAAANISHPLVIHQEKPSPY